MARARRWLPASAMEGHIQAQAEMFGTFSRS
jgi:hypothetical protein